MADESQVQIDTFNSDEDVNPRAKHLRKLAQEAEARKKAKETNRKAERVEYEIAYDTRGKKKYRKLTYMPDGTRHSEYVRPEIGEAKMLQQKKKGKI